MPIFEYVCQECHHEFETLIFGRNMDRAKAKCPKCESSALTPQLSVFAVSARGSAGSGGSPAAGACGSCGDPRGPGACSMGDLD